MNLNTSEKTNYIGGSWEASLQGQTAVNRNPARQDDVVGEAQLSEPEDIERAVRSAGEALVSWRRLSGAQRGDYLYRAAAVMEQRSEELATCMTREMGKTLPESKGEVARGVALLRYYAGEGMRKVGDVIPSTDAGALMYTTRVPLGVVGVITPWNFPVAIPVWKLAPALIYGNTAVWTPAFETSITATKVAACFHEAGMPAGVLNLVTGRGPVVGAALCEHPQVHGVTFTGSNAVGKQIGMTCLARGAKYQLEMGGKNPLIVLEDADLELAVEAAISGGLRSTGQKCTATSRVFVHDAVYEAFRDKLVERVNGLRVGDGMAEAVWMGPCANERQLEKVLGHIDRATREGARLLVGGQRLKGAQYDQGWFVAPTVFEAVTLDMAIAREEIFGPVLGLIRVGSLQEALQLANDTEYGLSASIYTANIGSMLTFVQDMEAGLVRVNAETAGVELQAPFGGMKQSSSHSREQGQAAIEFFTSIKTVFVKA